MTEEDKLNPVLYDYFKKYGLKPSETDSGYIIHRDGGLSNVPPHATDANKADPSKESFRVYRDNWNRDFLSLDLSNPADLFRLNAYEHIGSEVQGADLDLELARRKDIINNAFEAFKLTYNSEAMKLKRLQAIGMNPQLTGLENASQADIGKVEGNEGIGAAAQQNALTKEQQDREYKLNLATSVIDGIVSVVGSCFSMGTTLASTLADVATKKVQLRNMTKQGEVLDNEIQSSKSAAASSALNVLNSASQFAENLALGHLSSQFVDKDIATVTSSDISTALDPAGISDFGKWTSDPVANAAISKQLNAYRQNPDTLRHAWQARRDSERARREMISEVDTYGTTVQDIQRTLSPLQKIQIETSYELSKLQKESAEAKREYLAAIDVGAAADSFNANSDAVTAKARLDAVENKRKQILFDALSKMDEAVMNDYNSLMETYKKDGEIPYWKTAAFNLQLQQVQTLRSILMGENGFVDNTQTAVGAGLNILNNITDFFTFD